jgi:hypothetical protein
MFRQIVKNFRSRPIDPPSGNEGICEQSILLQGRLGCHANAALDRLETLSEAEFRVYSQWGEDGILEWLIQRLPMVSTRFIEFGVESYRESNTRFLLINRNWKGLVMDGSPQHIKSVQREAIYWRHDLTALCAFIDRDNINDLITQGGFSGNVGLLSVDIDGNDYWVWEALNAVNPDIIVCEYNAVFGDLVPITVPYVQNFHRTAFHYSNLYYGASIAALKLLAHTKGYEFIGSNRAGNNGFFLRSDLVPLVSRLIQRRAAFPSLFRESRDKEGKLTFRAGLDRLYEIRDLPVVRLDTGSTVPLGSIGPLYSPGWLRCIGTDSMPS